MVAGASATYEDALHRLSAALDAFDAVVVGAGAGLSAAAGYTYSGERFERYFGDFIARYSLRDMYSAGFFPYPTPEEHWAYWSRHIWVNRYAPAPRDTFSVLRELVADKDFFVITTNVDHAFQRAGFPKERLFYTQGDYGLWQCSVPCHDATYDNYETVRAMIEAQGWTIELNGELRGPQDNRELKHRVPTHMVPHCPKCGAPMRMNLREDNTFVEDAGWHETAACYGAFLDAHQTGKVLYLELGVGANTPGIIKFPFIRRVLENPEATYACVNKGEAYTVRELSDRSVLVDGDIDRVLCNLHDLRALQEMRGLRGMRGVWS